MTAAAGWVTQNAYIARQAITASGVRRMQITRASRKVFMFFSNKGRLCSVHFGSLSSQVQRAKNPPTTATPRITIAKLISIFFSFGPCFSLSYTTIILQSDLDVKSFCRIYFGIPKVFLGGEAMPSDNYFGRRLRELREQAGLTQKQLAEKASLSQKAISSWEQEGREPGWSMVVALAKVLNVSLDTFAEPPAGDTTPRGRGRPPKAEPLKVAAKKRKGK